MHKLYPPIQPYSTGFLPVDSIHTIYYEECGNKHGIPIVFLHGGPGSGLEEIHRQYFDPTVYRIILFDQRGSGKSLPHACLEANTTWDLVSDIEKIRSHCKVERWVVFGGSWGSTLALAYAIKHPQAVLGLILRGIFLCREEELKWFYQYGAHFIFPDAWENYLAPIEEKERDDLIKAYYKKLTSSHQKTRQEAALAWAAWEGSALKLHFDPKVFSAFIDPLHADSISRIECHYFINKVFFPSDNWIIENIASIRHIPGIIVHGRYDIICPLDSAWKLHKAWPESTLKVIPDAGHASSEPGIIDALIEATKAFKSLL